MNEIMSGETLPPRLQQENLSILVTRAVDVSKSYVRQLVEKSRQPHIEEFEGYEDIGTPDAPGRFRTIEDYYAWAESKQRIMFLLIDATRRVDFQEVPDVGGVAWFGKRENDQAPGRSVTFAMRNYAADEQHNWGQYVGRGLAAPFMDVTHRIARDIYPGQKVWLDLVAGNTASHKMCARAGYEELTRHSDGEDGGRTRIVMINDTVFQ
jgi:hypothetical protein